MASKTSRLVALSVMLGALNALSAPNEPQPVHVDDPGRLATVDTAWASGMEHRLEAVEAASGIRIMLQFHLKSPSAQEDSRPGVYMNGIATRLGIAQTGVLIVYFADDPDWRVWVGDDLTSRFAGKPGTAKELTASGAMHEAKEAFLAASLGKADAQFKASQPQDPSRHLDLQATALVEGLCAKLGAR